MLFVAMILIARSKWPIEPQFPSILTCFQVIGHFTTAWALIVLALICNKSCTTFRLCKDRVVLQFIFNTWQFASTKLSIPQYSIVHLDGGLSLIISVDPIRRSLIYCLLYKSSTPSTLCADSGHFYVDPSISLISDLLQDGLIANPLYQRQSSPLPKHPVSHHNQTPWQRP